MVTSVNNAALAALRAQENALVNRQAPDAQPPAASNSQLTNDPAVVYAGSLGATDVSVLLSVQDGLNRAASISDVALSAGRTISDLLSMMKDKAGAAKDAGADDQKQALDGDYQQILGAIDQIARSASFQGVKMLDGASSELHVKADAEGAAVVTLTPQDFTAAGPVIGLAGTDLKGSADDIANVLGQVDAASGRVDRQLSKLSGQSELIQGHLGVLSQLQSAMVGADGTDLDADTARLQALQVAQGLSDQGSPVASQAPQALLALFRS